MFVGLFVLFFGCWAQELNVWPKVVMENCQEQSGLELGGNFDFVVVGSGASNREVVDLVDWAVERFRDETFSNVSARSPSKTSIRVFVKNNSVVVPFLGVNETYGIRIVTGGVIEVVGETVFGAIWGLESLSQFFDAGAGENGTVVVPNCTVWDEPRFGWRGFLLDTARYYFSTEFILHVLDAMAYNKLNVLHWHAVDAQSFPLESSTFPLLASKGAFEPNSFFCNATISCTYSRQNMTRIVEYARQRGIRVVLELDSPGHVYSWGMGYPNATVGSCYIPIAFNKDSVPADPTNMEIESLIDGLMDEWFGEDEVFVDEYFFGGGDEVDFECWELTEHVAEWMEARNLTASETQALMVANTQKIVQAHSRIPVQWDDVVNGSHNLDPDTVIAVWHNASDLADFSNNFRTILSAGWYLSSDILNPTNWTTFYTQEPFEQGHWSPESKARVLGGEVSKWGGSGFVIVPTTEELFDPLVWPAACAVSERLWSPATVNNTSAAEPRLLKFREHLVCRGINANNV